MAPFGQGYEWNYGTYEYPFGDRGCYFHGHPSSADRSQLSAQEGKDTHPARLNAFKITFASVAYERLDADLVEQGPVALGVIA